MDVDEAEAWIRTYVEPAGAIEVVHERPWATVLRVPAGDTAVWFKACGPVAAFEPRLTAQLSARWPDVIPEVIAHDEDRAWLLLAHGGTPVGVLGNPPEAWEAALPPYAELQRGETAYAADHLAHGVPDLRVEVLPDRYATMIARDDIPLEPHEIDRLRRFEHGFALANVYERDGRMLVLDWGDSCVSHPFASLLETFIHLDELRPDDPWYARLRDAYLEPWGPGLADTFELALRVAPFAHAIAWFRQLDNLPDGEIRTLFLQYFPAQLRRAVAQADE